MKSWYQTLKVGTYTTWDEVAQKFLLSYYPLKLKIDIAQFQHLDGETFYEAWKGKRTSLGSDPIMDLIERHNHDVLQCL